MFKNLVWVPIVIAILFGVAVGVATATGSDEAQADHGQLVTTLSRLTIAEDTFYNWDFSAQAVSIFNVDWPIAFLFYNNANVAKVKTALSGAGYGSSIFNSTKHLLLNDTGLEEWDSDSGLKSNCLSNLSTPHMRVYAPSNTDKFFNVSWSFYVLGAAHVDVNECAVPPAPNQFGFSEDAEDEIASNLLGEPSVLAVFQDWASFFNAMNVQVGDHIVKNNGLATAVFIQ